MRGAIAVVFLLLICLNLNQVQSKVKFSSRESRIGVSGGSLFFSNEFDVAKGTFEVDSGSFLGANLLFNDGQYRLNKKKADIDGTLLAEGLGYIFGGSEVLTADPGMKTNPFLVIGIGNVLAGQPDLQGTNTLLNSFSELQVNISNKLSQSLAMNGGTITLLQDLSLGDDVTLTGSGRINFNNKTLRLPAKESVWTSNLFFHEANDLVLGGKTSLSGQWIFDGASAVLQGDGNVLDLTSGGTLWIKSGADVAFTDLHIRGLGQTYGTIVFEDATSHVRLSNVTLQFNDNYTMTKGAIYAEGGSSLIVTGTNLFTIDTGASLHVDGLTLFADSLDVTPTVNISPNIPDGIKLIYLNNGILRAQGEAVTAADTPLGIATSNAVAGLLVAVSSSVVSQLESITDNSDAIVGWIQDTSNSLDSLYGLVVENSDAIVSLSQGITNNSNAITGWIQNTSNSLNSLHSLVIENSSAILGVSQGVTGNSDAIVGWILDTSNALNNTYGLVVDNSWSILAVLDRIISPTTRYLLEAHPTASVVMDESLFLYQDHFINIHGDMRIDGSGGTIYFADPLSTQLVLQPSVRLSLRNITFANLHQDNIYIPSSSELIIEENVTFYLSRDMTFSVGKIVLASEASIFTVHGYGGVKQLVFNAAASMDLGSSSLVLQDVEFTGIESMKKSSTFIDGQLIEGGIVCAGRAQVNILKSNSMNFLIENIDNIFEIRANNIALRGSISYGISQFNTLNIQFSLFNSTDESYRLILGDNSLYVFSNIGSAHILFNDFLVEIFNEGSNSFLLDARSGLFGQNIFVQNFPIKLLSTQFTLDQFLQLATDQQNAIDISFIRGFDMKLLHTRPILAYQLK